MPVKTTVFLCFLSLLVLLAAPAAESAEPIPVPSNIRVTSSKPRERVWASLTSKEKKLAYHLIEAARAGRLVLFNQNHRHALKIKQLIETALDEENLSDAKALLGQEGFAEFLSYSAKFEDMSGPYEPSNRKYVLSKVSSAQVENLFKIFLPKVGARSRLEAARLMTDPNYEVMRMPESQDGSGIELTGGNLYEKGITGEDLRKAFVSGLETANCLNCRIIKAADGSLMIERQTVNTPGVVGRLLSRVVRSLRLALPYASTDLQAKQIAHLINHLETGDVEEFRQSNIAWVKDGTSSKVDFMMGFVEVYEDFKASIGSWESYVQVIDPETTKRSVSLASNAQYFENKMPYGQYKKTFSPDYAPPAAMVYYFLENASMHTSGYNLPNFDDIRRDVGFKNAIRLDMPGQEADPLADARWKEVFSQFTAESAMAGIEKHHEKAWRVIVLLHEIIGHGSGTYDESKYGKGVDPMSKLGNLGSALEEQRADLAALAFIDDPKLVDVGIYNDAAEALEVRDAAYDYIVADFLRRTARDRTFQEAHQRGHWLFINILLERQAVAWVAKDGTAEVTPPNAVLAVKDYELFKQVAIDLLAELQRIKATRDESALETLFAEKAPLSAIDEPWAQDMIKRGQNVQINAGSLEQPWRVDRQGGFSVLCEELLLEAAAPQWKNQ